MQADADVMAGCKQGATQVTHIVKLSKFLQLIAINRKCCYITIAFSSISSKITTEHHITGTINRIISCEHCIPTAGMWGRHKSSIKIG